MTRKLALLTIIGLGLFALTACKKTPPCPSKYSALSADQKKDAFKCTCDGKAMGSVWGDKLYTIDSNICRAAVHAGVLPAGKSGKVSVVAAKGCGAYRGATRNGVKSSSWGPYRQSFMFPGKGDPKCPPASLGAMVKGSLGQLGAALGKLGSKVGKAAKNVATGMAKAAKKTLKNAANALGSALSKAFGGLTGKKSKLRPGECPRRWNYVANYRKQAKYTCKCFPGAAGSVWGSKIYTADSSICRAAVHAGAIPATGGQVSAKSASGCPKYKGSAANGVTSRNWGKYSTSFYFPGKGSGTCN